MTVQGDYGERRLCSARSIKAGNCFQRSRWITTRDRPTGHRRRDPQDLRQTAVKHHTEHVLSSSCE
ncbi:hypothetical protein L917_04113, partial [Phytophthora nicotianae]